MGFICCKRLDSGPCPMLARNGPSKFCGEGLMLRAERTWRGRYLRVTRVTPLTFYPEWDGAGCHQGAGAPQVHGGLGRAFARNYVRRNSLEYSGLRGEGSTPVPLPPPNSPCGLRVGKRAMLTGKIFRLSHESQRGQRRVSGRPPAWIGSTSPHCSTLPATKSLLAVSIIMKMGKSRSLQSTGLACWRESSVRRSTTANWSGWGSNSPASAPVQPSPIGDFASI